MLLNALKIKDPKVYPYLLMTDFPEKKFYSLTAVGSADSVRNFVQDYNAGALKATPLG